MTATKAKIEELMSIGVDIGKDVFHLVGFSPDTYQRLPENMQMSSCEQQPVHTMGSNLPFAAWTTKVRNGSFVTVEVVRTNVRFVLHLSHEIVSRQMATSRRFCWNGL